MYCKNCGKEIADDSKFCPFCGTDLSVPTESVSSMTVLQNDEPSNDKPSQKFRLASLLFAIFLGRIGVHNFYVGDTKFGVIKCILFAVGLFIWPVLFADWAWTIADIVMIACGTFKDGTGKPITKWTEN